MNPILNNSSGIEGCRTTRIYCRTGCPAGKRMNPGNRVYFQSREEAKGLGYRACKICKPDATAVEPDDLFLTRYASPLGTYCILSSKKGIVCCEPEEEAENRIGRWQSAGSRIKEENNACNASVAVEMDNYFAGKLSYFDLPLDLRGTPFQLRVWLALQEIPYGETVSYGDLAHRLGQDGAARAVGGAVGSNPVSIIVPCHRVIGSNGSLTGYGGGLPRKISLLKLEADNKARAAVVKPTKKL